MSGTDRAIKKRRGPPPPIGGGPRTTEASAAIKRRNQIRAAEFRAALRRQEGR